MTALRRRMMEDLQLAGYSPRTVKSYIDTVRVLANYYHRSPDLLTDEEVRRFFVYLIDERKLSAILKLVKRPIYRMALTIIYACGLRISEGIRLQTSDIDGKRHLLRVRNGKGGKDRYVPLHEHPLELLRTYYRKHGRGSVFLFPLKKGHIPADSLQRVFKQALRESSVNKSATVHTLRHSFATHLVENGEDISTIKEILGHSSIVTTNVYTHLTEKITARLHVSLDGMMAGLQP